MSQWKIVKIGIICLSALLFLAEIKIEQSLVYLNMNEKEMYASPLLWSGNSFEEVFVADHQMSLCIQIRPITWNYIHEEGEVLEVKLKRIKDEEILKVHTFNVQGLPDNSLTDYIFFDNIRLEKDEKYSIVLESNISDPDRGIGFGCTEKSDENAYAVIDGEKQDYNFSMILYE